MSRFATMTTRERKLQAAVICREIQSGEDAEMDPGKKVSVPEDIMLEELSLTSNRGSRLFKMRQKRSEKYTFESVRNQNNTQPNATVGFQVENGNTADDHGRKKDPAEDQPSQEQPDMTKVSSPERIAPGYGTPLKAVPPEKFNRTALPKSYRSPWETAAGVDLVFPEPTGPCAPSQPPSDQPVYRSFNRVAVPFGGYRPDPVQTLGPELLPHHPEIQTPNQACFNRSALGWVSTCPPVPASTPPLERLPISESGDL